MHYQIEEKVCLDLQGNEQPIGSANCKMHLKRGNEHAILACICLSILYLVSTLLVECAKCMRSRAYNNDLEILANRLASRDHIISYPPVAETNRHRPSFRRSETEFNEVEEVRSLRRPQAMPMTVGEAFFSYERGSVPEQNPALR